MTNGYHGQPTISEVDAAKLIAERSGQPISGRLVFHAWPESFPNTTGPFGGIGGQAFTTFQIEAWEADVNMALVFCNGKALGFIRDFDAREQWQRMKNRRVT
jgi:hypothetical protein